LLRNQIWYDEDLSVGEDFTLYLECLRKQAKFYLLGQPYYYYLLREMSLSTRKPTEYLAESCTITENFINREVDSTAESCLLEALIENLIVFQKRLAFYHFLEIIKEKKLWAAIVHTLNNPFVISNLIEKSSMVLSRKIMAVNKKLLPTPSSRVIYPDLRQWLLDLK